MNRKTELREMQRWFDGAASPDSHIQARWEHDSELAEELHWWSVMRAGCEQVRAHPTIADTQMPAFLDQVRESIQQAPGRRFGGWWAFTSVAAAALLVAVSAFVIFSGGPSEVKAHTVVENYSTELEGATVDMDTTEDGTVTIWVNTAQKDVL